MCSRLRPKSLARKLLKMVCGFCAKVGRVAKIQAIYKWVALFDGPAELSPSSPRPFPALPLQIFIHRGLGQLKRNKIPVPSGSLGTSQPQPWYHT